jgi:choline dehydrogenase-like flavoprotein
MANDINFDCEYIVVGSGAGGGTVAARLAEAGHSVIVLEAGGDPRKLQGGNPNNPETNSLPEDYDVPVFHGLATENTGISWDFYVRHYSDLAQSQKDTKFYPEKGGVLYPRSGALGGCTAHNAQILVYPANKDWDDIANLTGDPSWKSDQMRRYFELLEDCQHRPLDRLLAETTGHNPSQHGWKGWLQTEKAIPEEALGDNELLHTLAASAFKAFVETGHPIEEIGELLESQLDPNDWRVVEKNGAGIRYTPLMTRNHQRSGTRERLLNTMSAGHPLRIETDALATEVIFEDGANGSARAIGVRYLKGGRLYRAFNPPSGSAGDSRAIYASREVILAGGAFNTPQLLMLSGIGPAAHLAQLGIPVRVALEGVGKNLQDRYEVGVVNEMSAPWEVLKDAKFAKGDPQFAEWQTGRKGVYTTNGAVLGVIRKSSDVQPVPDLLCFALLGFFRGYWPGYSALFAQKLNYLTWAVLKGHTTNRAGEVTLRSRDPLDMPNVNFHYFNEGTGGGTEDLDAVVDGIKFVRTMTRDLKKSGLITEEVLPGELIQTDDQLREYVRDNAWGHHASCTCPIGLKEQGGVLTSDFKVHGTQGLRVVDASVFPRIPGLFVLSSVFMIGEKAAEVILQQVSG